MKLRLRHFLKFTSLLLYLFVLSCEDVELAYPGNDQDLDAVPPSGDIVWAIDTDENGEKGYLEENSASGKTIGTLNATDGNPDDVFTYSIKSQKIDNSGVNYFILTADSGNVNLVLNNGNLNYCLLYTSDAADE